MVNDWNQSTKQFWRHFDTIMIAKKYPILFHDRTSETCNFFKHLLVVGAVAVDSHLVVRVWVFRIRSSYPFPTIWLGRDVSGECSTKTMGIGNGVGSESVLPW